MIQSLKSGKTWKCGLVPMSRQEKLADLFLVFPARLQTWPKAFHSYFFIKHSKNEAFRHFLVNFMKQLHRNDDRHKKIDSQFLLYIFPSSTTAKLHYHQVTGKKLSTIKIFKIFLSDHLKTCSDQILEKLVNQWGQILKKLVNQWGCCFSFFIEMSQKF